MYYVIGQYYVIGFYMVHEKLYRNCCVHTLSSQVKCSSQHEGVSRAVPERVVAVSEEGMLRNGAQASQKLLDFFVISQLIKTYRS